ncbi:MAG: 50S ribosomal protein L11 methyltransferase [Planctomycetes bacterium]|nr:50S ribosomal protein L11 methyltransferase [Planctomycetota bacterium]
MSAAALRAFELTGAERSAALEWLHVHADVRGAIEGEDTVTVFVAGSLPAPPFGALALREIAVPTDSPTGLEHDRVIVVADDLIVRPPWVASPPGFAGIELVVPRGAAFGSGEHDSTQAALLMLHALWEIAAPPPGCADVGTGSGILLLYAAARGCRHLQGCDIDAVAVAAAAELLPDARFAVGGPARLAPAACVVANMTGSELAAALDDILALWDRRGPLVLAGMRATEVDGIRARLPGTPARTLTRGAFTALGYAGVR